MAHKTENITTNIKVKVDFTLPTLIAMNLVMWKCHVDDSARGRYDTILGHDLLIELGLNLKLSEHFIKPDDGTFKGLQHPWLIWVHIYLKIQIQGKLHPKNSLLMLTPKKYTSQNMYVLLQNDYV